MLLRLVRAAICIFVIGTALPVRAVDPPYQADMERLAEILGNLYFLEPMCRPTPNDWRAEMASLIELDQPDDDRRQRLTGAFNGGYAAYSRLHRVCTVSAAEALERLLLEAEKVARGIYQSYAE